jgi:hypothetical protein
MHLAQLNIARLAYDFNDPRVAEFMDNLARVNGIAERSEGFVWRLQDEAGDATAFQAFDDPQVIVNMSVWRSADELEHFVWNTVHKQFYRKRAEWFSAMKSQHFVMWWVDEGHVPTVEEARNKLDTLERHGDSDLAFGWSHLPHIKLWQQARCA